MPIEKRDRITRQMLRDEPKTLFVFGDNLQRTGLGGQAKEMRGEPNAFGIPTKHRPSMDEKSFFRDSDFEIVAPLIVDRFLELHSHLACRGKVVWPAAGIGTGLADLKNKAPRIWTLIEGCQRILEQAYAKDGGK
jgi:hypothetical protein